MPLASSPIIYWYPDDTGTLETIDLVRCSALALDPTRNVAVSRSLSGREQVADYGGQARVTIGREPIAGTEAALLRDLRALDQHLQKGGRFGFSLRQDKAWAVWATRYILRGNTSVQHTGVGLYEPTATLANGDVVAITSANPERQDERCTISVATSSSVTLSEGARYSHRTTPVLLRWEDYWPVLKLSQEGRGTSIIQDLGYRRLWRLSIPAVEDTDALWRLAARGGAALRGTTGTQLPTLAQALLPAAPSSTTRSTTTTIGLRT
jgi:hypothetical protein